ncbi:unnamed protein product, partial [Nesidiocoris tenuis]
IPQYAGSGLGCTCVVTSASSGGHSGSDPCYLMVFEIKTNFLEVMDAHPQECSFTSFKVSSIQTHNAIGIDQHPLALA